jgi:adenylate kinase
MMRILTATTLGAVIAMSIATAQQAPPTVIILVGPPGSGKTTQAGFLSKKYGIPAFSMADLLAKELKSNKTVSKAFASAIASGEVLPDDKATEMIRTRLLRANPGKGFVLDGYPATSAQAKSLDKMVEELGLPKAVVVVLQAPDDVLRKRLLARGGADDKPENIERRVREFRQEAALLEGWAGETRIVRVDSTASISRVSTQIVAGIEEVWSNKGFAQRP